MIIALRQVYPGMTAACWRRLHRDGEDALPRRVDQCFAMMPAQRWRGIWNDYFEGQQFCAAGRRCSGGYDRTQPWITFADGVRPTSDLPTNRRYVIEFIGRRTKMPGFYGHLGSSDHEIVVDRVISITPAPADAASAPRR
ncbi:hypothetical protein ABS767_07475 [Sphingomonas sp. ST-64]|uniref:Uncharacterized protein n=1 Tax=Sphingomonas plantiphila TaxID=3163295 RepID=A0ABW8YNN0_9SPHN